MPAMRSVNLKARNINISRDTNLRKVKTWSTRDDLPVDNPHFAILGLSTKAVKLLIGRDEDAIRNAESFNFDYFIKDAVKTEIGQGLTADNTVGMHYFENRRLMVIQRMKQMMRQERVEVVYCVVNAAYRTARNRDGIVKYIKGQICMNEISRYRVTQSLIIIILQSDLAYLCSCIS